ncbi:MAG: stage III sporulation protein AA [Cellulosilyticaceae bacterium]
MIKDHILRIMPPHIKNMLGSLKYEDYEKLQEIRLRIGQPVLLIIRNEEYGVNITGLTGIENSYRVTQRDLDEIIKFISGFSLYAIEDELRQGYMTIEGGHRIGIVGKVVIENGAIKTLKNISALNIRVAHQVLGCSQKVLPYILTRDRIYHTLIVSPPKCGKTTLLRDITRALSEGYYGYGPYTIGLVDERSEIAGCYLGIAQNDVGMRTDVLDACPKVEGMKMLLRSMAPDVIVVDEIGKREDILAIEEVLASGVTIIATVHGKDLEDCKRKPLLNEMLQEGLFERIIILSSRQGPCTVESIIDAKNGFRSL